MAGSDPKANRALGQAARRAELDSDEDPLVELARIVSEDSGFAGPKLQKAKMNRHEQNSRNNSSDGLEAELLQELETAFPVREEPAMPQAEVVSRANATQAASAALAEIAPVRRPVEEDPDPDQLLRSIEEQLSQFERRQAHRFVSTLTPVEEATEATAGAEEQSFDEQAEDSAPVPFGAPRKPEPLEDEWQQRPTSRIRAFTESGEARDQTAEATSETTAEADPAPALAPRSEYRFRGPANADWDRPEAASREKSRTDLRLDDALRVSRERVQALRSMEPVPEPESEVPSESAPVNGARRGKSPGNATRETARRERLAAAFPEFDDEPQASQPAAPDFADVEASLSRDLEQPLLEGSSSLADKWQDGDAPAEEPTVAAAIAPAPSRRAAAARAAAQQRSRSRIGMLVAAIILVVVIGGGAAFYLRSSESTPSGPPPVIAAEPGEVRVQASDDKSATESDSAGDAVYNRVAGTTPPAQEQVVENSEEPREVARIVLPPPQSNADNTVVRPVGEGESTSATTEAAPGTALPPAAAAPEQTANAETEIGPRRVPTFVVKADGSIVATNEGAPAAQPEAPAATDQLADTTKPIEPVPVPTVAIAEAEAPAETGAPAVAEDQAPPPATDLVTAPTATPVTADDLATRPTIDEPPAEVTAPPAAAPAEAPVAPALAVADTASTEELAAAAPSEAQTLPPTVASGGYLVQISSQRSMEQAQAAYASAQKRFPALLGSLTPQIQQADLGAKGIYYRVKVGPWGTRDEAIKVCESLKAAGGSCLVTR